VKNRLHAGLIALVVFGLLLGTVSTASAATTWKKVTPPAKVVKYAKHAKSHGMQAWYPSRLPSGYKLQSMQLRKYKGLPWCYLVFKNGAKRITMSQGTSYLIGEDHGTAEFAGRVAWGSQKADLLDDGYICWWSAKKTAFAGLDGEGVTSTQARSIAKYMKKVR
jgi:hypothetical protein